MKALKSNFYLIKVDDKPVYVGYTNRPIKTRFREHLHDKDFGDGEVTQDSLGSLSFDFTWDITLINQYAHEVSDKETGLITEYGTGDSVWQKGINGNSGGQTWADIKHFVMTNKDNPKFAGLSEDEILAYLQQEGIVRQYMTSFVNNIEDPIAVYMKNFVNHIDSPVAVYMTSFVSSIKSPIDAYMSHFVSHIEDPTAVYMSRFVSSIQDPIAVYMTGFVSTMILPEVQYMRSFVARIKSPIDAYMSHFVSGIQDPIAVYMTGFVSTMILPEEQYMRSFVAHIESPVAVYMGNFVTNMNKKG